MEDEMTRLANDILCTSISENTQDVEKCIEVKNSDIEEHDFNLKIIGETTNSLCINWNLLDDAEVYEIEKYDKKHGWEGVAWTSKAPKEVQNLKDNFACRFRVRALRFVADAHSYVPVKISPDIVGSTKAAEPTTLCLHRAIKKGQQFLVKHILRRRPSLIEYPGPNGYLPLANAIASGDACIIDILLMCGASVHNGNPRNGRTPLHLAFYYGRLPVARMLLNKRANLESRDENGMTPCHFAVDANQCDMLSFAIDCGANLEASDACGYTLLLRAVVMRCDVSLLKLLVTHGANTKAIDGFGKSCLDLARLFDNEEATKYFTHYFEVKAEQLQLSNT